MLGCALGEDDNEALPDEMRTVLAEMRTIMAEKRTSLALLRTGLAVCTVPISIFAVLIATSRYYDVRSVFYPLIMFIALCLALLALGIHTIVKAFLQIRLHDKKINTMKEQMLTRREETN